MKNLPCARALGSAPHRPIRSFNECRSPLTITICTDVSPEKALKDQSFFLWWRDWSILLYLSLLKFIRSVVSMFPLSFLGLFCKLRSHVLRPVLRKKAQQFPQLKLTVVQASNSFGSYLIVKLSCTESIAKRIDHIKNFREIDFLKNWLLIWSYFSHLKGDFK